MTSDKSRKRTRKDKPNDKPNQQDQSDALLDKLTERLLYKLATSKRGDYDDEENDDNSDGASDCDSSEKPEKKKRKVNKHSGSQKSSSSANRFDAGGALSSSSSKVKVGSKSRNSSKPQLVTSISSKPTTDLTRLTSASDQVAAIHIEPPTDLRLSVGAIWLSFWSLYMYTVSWARQLGFVIAKRHTNKMSNEEIDAMKLVNPNALVDRDCNNISRGTFGCTGCRGTCIFQINFGRLKESVGGQVIITHVEWRHSDHPLSNIGPKTLESQLTEPEKSFIGEISGTSMKTFRFMMSEKFLETSYSNTLMYRVRHKAKIARFGEPGSLEDFLKKMDDMKKKGGRFEIELDETCTIKNMYIQMPEWREYAITYPDYVLVDGTFNMTTYDGVVMLVCAVVDALEHTVIAGVAFIQSENSQATVHALRLFGLDRPGATLHSDGALGFSSAAQELQMKHMLCAWHVAQQIPSNIASTKLSSSLPGTSAETSAQDIVSQDEEESKSESALNDGVSSDENDEEQRGRGKKPKSKITKEIHNLIWNEFASPIALDNRIETMITEYAGNTTALNWIRRIANDRERLAATHTRTMFSAGHNSSSRVEGQFGVIKKDMTPNNLANLRYPELVEHLNMIFRTRTETSHREMLKILRANSQLDWRPSLHLEWNARFENVYQLVSTRESEQVNDNAARFEVCDSLNIERKWFVEIDETNQEHAKCTCLQFTTKLIPCEHICIVLINEQKRFRSDMIAMRWRLSSHPLFERCREQLEQRIGQTQPVTVVPRTPVDMQQLATKKPFLSQIPVNQNAVLREAAVQKLLDLVFAESKRSLGHHAMIMHDLTGVINRSTAVSTSSAAAALTSTTPSDSIASGAAIHDADTPSMGLEPNTRRSGPGRPKKSKRASDSSLASIKHKNKRTPKERTPSTRRCGGCHEIGHQSNNRFCPAKIKAQAEKDQRTSSASENMEGDESQEIDDSDALSDDESDSMSHWNDDQEHDDDDIESSDHESSDPHSAGKRNGDDDDLETEAENSDEDSDIKHNDHNESDIKYNDNNLVIPYSKTAELTGTYWRKLASSLPEMLVRRGGLHNGQCGAHAILTSIHGEATHQQTVEMRQSIAHELFNAHDNTPNDKFRAIARKLPSIQSSDSNEDMVIQRLATTIKEELSGPVTEFSSDLVMIACILRNVNLFLVTMTHTKRTERVLKNVVISVDEPKQTEQNSKVVASSVEEPIETDVTCQVICPELDSCELTCAKKPNTIAIIHTISHSVITTRELDGSKNVKCSMQGHYESLIDRDGYGQWCTDDRVVKRALMPAAFKTLTKVNNNIANLDQFRSERVSEAKSSRKKYSIFRMNDLAMFQPTVKLLDATKPHACIPNKLGHTSLPVRIVGREMVSRAIDPSKPNHIDPFWLCYKIACVSGLIDGEFWCCDIEPLASDEQVLHDNIPKRALIDTMQIIDLWSAWTNHLMGPTVEDSRNPRTRNGLNKKQIPLCATCMSPTTEMSHLVMCLGCSKWVHYDQCNSVGVRQALTQDCFSPYLKHQFHNIQCLKKHHRNVRSLASIQEASQQ